MTVLNISARYGWWKTLAIFAIAGGIIGVVSDGIFPHHHTASSIAFAAVLVVLIAVIRPFEPRTTGTRRRTRPKSERDN